MGSQSLSEPLQQYRSYRNIRSKLPVPFAVVIIVGIVLIAQFTLIPQLIREPSSSWQQLSQHQLDRLNSGLHKCRELKTPPIKYDVPTRSRVNPRWNPVSGQKKAIVLRNATLFSGGYIDNVDIKFKDGIVISVSKTGLGEVDNHDATVINLNGKFVTPGLIDMHSHHLVGAWPGIPPSNDVNEVNAASGPLTPFVRSKDSMKADDLATAIIASGGITSSLILPGSANIMGGEGFMVKNALLSGADGEEVVEELLLEHGIPLSDRRRYMKMACGENPKRVYDHTRMGNAWVFRHHMERAKELVEKQDTWCLSAAVAKEQRNERMIASLVTPDSNSKGGLPEELELDSTVAILRGKIGVNIHCYEPEDFEDILLHSKEFGFRIQAFHHALSAWKVPELIKESGENITIATFSTFGLYKKEAYDANLWAGSILEKHDIPVAYKSDHGDALTNAKYLIFQAATAHSFHLSETAALESVTSVPAKSLGLDHRIGFVKPGYDADIVVWDSHPLSVGATPLQVYIDGRPTLDEDKARETLFRSSENKRIRPEPKMKASPAYGVCERLAKGKTVIVGITRSYLKSANGASMVDGELQVVLEDGKVICHGSSSDCLSARAGAHIVVLKDGHVLPGLTAVSTTLGLTEIATEDQTGDGSVKKNVDPSDPDNVIYAKYGIHLEGRAFDRAKIAGVTRGISTPLGKGFLRGVSVGIKTHGNNTVLDGGVFRDNVALHFAIGQESKKTESTPTISSAVAKLRKILQVNTGKENIYGQAVNGSLPLVIHTNNKYDIQQIIRIKQDFTNINVVIYGGAEAPAVAKEIAAANIPLILTAARPAPDNWESQDVLVGPPLTRSPASVLSEAGVKFALAIQDDEGDSFIINLPLEASWAAKYAGLSDHAAVDLVSRNVEEILELDIKEENRDFVVFEGDPLEFGASVVMSVDGEDGRMVTCWPESN